MSEQQWMDAAHRLGEALASVGPHGYYLMTPDEWLAWALAQLPDEVYRIPLHEAKAREKIIRRIIVAKREAGFQITCDFFDDVWPVALAALKREPPPVPNLGCATTLQLLDELQARARVHGYGNYRTVEQAQSQPTAGDSDGR